MKRIIVTVVALLAVLAVFGLRINVFTGAETSRVTLYRPEKVLVMSAGPSLALVIHAVWTESCPSPTTLPCD